MLIKNLFALLLTFSLAISGCSTASKTDSSVVEDSRELSGGKVGVIEDFFVGVAEHSGSKTSAETVKTLAEKALAADPAMKLFKQQYKFNGSLSDLMRSSQDTQMSFLDALSRSKLFRSGLPAVNNKKYYEIFGRVAEAAKSNSVAYAKMGYSKFEGLSKSSVLNDAELGKEMQKELGPETLPIVREAARKLEAAIAAADPSSKEKLEKVARVIIRKAIRIQKTTGVQFLGQGCALDNQAIENLESWVSRIESNVSSSMRSRDVVRVAAKELKDLLQLQTEGNAYERMGGLANAPCNVVNPGLRRDIATEAVSQ